MENQKIKKSAGRLSPTPMGDYDDTTTYRRLDWVYYGGTTYICKKNNTLGIKPSDPERWQKIIDEIGDMKIVFAEAEQLENITNGDKLSIIFGKIKKWFTHLNDIICRDNNDTKVTRIRADEGVQVSNRANDRHIPVYASDFVAGTGGTTGRSLANLSLKDLSDNNHIDVLTNINQITSIGFWKIGSIDSSYAQSIGITPNNNTGDFYAIVSNYNGDGSHFHYGNLQLYSHRLGTNFFTIQVWNEAARAECMIIHSNVLNTIEQISACTESPYTAGALAAKAMMADYNNKINQINSNMMNKGIFIDAWISKNIKIGGADDADYPASVNNQLPFDNYHKTGECFTLLPDGGIQCNRAGTVITFLQIVDTPDTVGMNLIYKLSSKNAPYSHEKRFGFRPVAQMLRNMTALNVYTVQNGTIITCEAINYTSASNVIINGINPYNTRILCILC